MFTAEHEKSAKGMCMIASATLQQAKERKKSTASDRSYTHFYLCMSYTLRHLPQVYLASAAVSGSLPSFAAL